MKLRALALAWLLLLPFVVLSRGALAEGATRVFRPSWPGYAPVLFSLVLWSGGGALCWAIALYLGETRSGDALAYLIAECFRAFAAMATCGP